MTDAYGVWWGLVEKKPDGIADIAVLPEGYNGERSESADILPVVNAWRTRWSVQKSAKIAGGVQGVDGPEVLGVLYQPFAAVQQQLRRRSAERIFSLERLVLLEVYHRRCSQIYRYTYISDSGGAAWSAHSNRPAAARIQSMWGYIRMMVKRPVLSDTRVSYVIWSGEVELVCSLQVTASPFDVQTLPPPPKTRDHLTLEFLPQNLDANSIKPDVYFVRLYGNSFPLRESLDWVAVVAFRYLCFCRLRCILWLVWKVWWLIAADTVHLVFDQDWWKRNQMAHEVQDEAEARLADMLAKQKRGSVAQALALLQVKSSERLLQTWQRASCPSRSSKKKMKGWLNSPMPQSSSRDVSQRSSCRRPKFHGRQRRSWGVCVWA